MKKAVTIYTDGACSGNPGPGGWGALLCYQASEKELYGSEPGTTNNRMELMAAIQALESLKEPVAADIYTDSEYVRKGLNEWLPKWLKNGWRTASRQPVKNQDLWERLVQASKRHELRWHWVKGHSGHPGNERADALARRGARAALPGSAETVTPAA